MAIFLGTSIRLATSGPRTSMWPTAGRLVAGTNGGTVVGDTRVGNGGKLRKQVAWSVEIPFDQ
ncbi:hypothetical protein HDU93_005973, partial [Gonapodya sp. JEL0774]